MQWDPFLIKVLMKKDICGSRKQYTGPTDSVISVKCVDVQKVGGPVSVFHVNALLVKKKKKCETQNAPFLSVSK